MISENLGLPIGYEGNTRYTKYGGTNNKVRKFDINLDTSIFSHSLNKSINIFNTPNNEKQDSKKNKTKRNRKK